MPQPANLRGTLERLLATPDFASKEWITTQYDHTVRTNTVRGPGGDAAVVLLKETPSGLAMTCDVNPVYCSLDPRRGGAQAVAEAVRNLACVGAEPVGLTDCLNFGNPERPEISWQFREAVRGISEACLALGVPVISGNVSFYNETEGTSIYPTPAIAAVGVIPSLSGLPESAFQRAGDRVVLLGEDRSEFGGSAYLRLRHDLEQGRPPEVDLAAEARLAGLLRSLIGRGLLRTAHDLADGLENAIAGGDTNSWDGPLVITATLLGQVTPRGSLIHSSKFRGVSSIINLSKSSASNRRGGSPRRRARCIRRGVRALARAGAPLQQRARAPGAR